MEGRLKLADAELYYRIDDFTDPWKKSRTMVLVHGFGESSEAWRGWVPHLARDYRVVRYDHRGFGKSSPMPESFPWSLDVVADDLMRVIDATAEGEGPVHLVAAKIGGPIAIRAAVTNPERVATLTLVGAPVKGPQSAAWIEQIRSEGVLAWSTTTMDARMGPAMPAEAKQWWIDLTAATPKATMIGFLGVAPAIDVTTELDRLQCPCLMITTDSKRHPLAEINTWLPKIRRADLFVVPGQAYHAAAVEPDLCARKTLEFVRKQDGQAG